MSERYVRTFAVEELPENTSKCATVDGHKVLVVHAGDEFFAIRNLCSHADSPMEGGRIRNKYISCPLHGMRFELRTGKPIGQLTRVPLTTYPVRIVDGHVEVALPEG